MKISRTRESGSLLYNISENQCSVSENDRLATAPSCDLQDNFLIRIIMVTKHYRISLYPANNRSIVVRHHYPYLGNMNVAVPWLVRSEMKKR